MGIISLLQSHHFQLIDYIILFFGMMADATIFLLAATFLIAQGFLNPIFGSLVILLGAWAEQLLMYFIGHSLQKSDSISKWADKIAKRFDGHIIHHPFRTFAISKFIYGLHRAVLIRAGMLKMGLKTFAKNSFAGTIIWVVILSALGYSLTASYTILKKYISYAELIPLVILIILFTIEYFVSKRLKKNL